MLPHHGRARPSSCVAATRIDPEFAIARAKPGPQDDNLSKISHEYLSKIEDLRWMTSAVVQTSEKKKNYAIKRPLWGSRSHGHPLHPASAHSPLLLAICSLACFVAGDRTQSSVQGIPPALHAHTAYPTYTPVLKAAPCINTSRSPAFHVSSPEDKERHSA